MPETAPDTIIDLASARFIASAHVKKDWPAAAGAEVAFAGRSNVGKSSAINAITGRRGLAKTSKTPGRTRQIVFFELATGQRLVDLPGYGFAKVPPEMRRHWEKTISDYLLTRTTLRGLVMPVDCRRLLTPLDEQMLAWCDRAALPVHILLTKADKLGRGQAKAALAALGTNLAGRPDTTWQLFSVLTRAGVDEARAAVIGLIERT